MQAVNQHLTFQKKMIGTQHVALEININYRLSINTSLLIVLFIFLVLPTF